MNSNPIESFTHEYKPVTLEQALKAQVEQHKLIYKYNKSRYFNEDIEPSIDYESITKLQKFTTASTQKTAIPNWLIPVKDAIEQGYPAAQINELAVASRQLDIANNLPQDIAPTFIESATHPKTIQENLSGHDNSPLNNAFTTYSNSRNLTY